MIPILLQLITIFGLTILLIVMFGIALAMSMAVVKALMKLWYEK